MARNHARINVGIWQDEDFCSLRPSVQRLYLFLLSQPNLTHLGVLPLTLRRWVKAAGAYSLDDLEADLDELTESGFVVVDQDSEELLVRSLLRNDGIYKQPNVMRSAVASAPSLHSDDLKRALLAEIARIDLEDVAEDKGKRDEARGLLRTLEDALALPQAKGSENPKRRVPDTPSEGFSEPPTHAHAQPLVLSPTPTPSTVPPTAAPLGAALAAVDDALTGNAAGVVAAYVDACRRHQQVEDKRAKGRIAKESAELLKSGAPYPLLVQAAQNLAANGYADIGAEARRLRAQPVVRPSTTDAKVAQTLALAERFRQLDEADAS